MRKDTVWGNYNDNYIKTTNPLGYDVLINGQNKYLNFNLFSGEMGYGFRDNDGTIEFKNDSGVWTPIGGGGGGGTWTPEGVTYQNVGGIHSGEDLGTSPVSISDTLTQIFYPYTAPSITSFSPSSQLFEIGNDQTNVSLSATYVKRTDPITSVVFKRNGTVIYTDPSPNPNGGTSSYVDTVGLSSTGTYSVEVSDGTTTSTVTHTFTFVGTYYYGVASPGLDISSDGGGLTKLLINNTATVAEQFSPVVQVYYFAYPNSYSALTSILDQNGFETIGDWTVSTVSVTNSYGAVISYRQYEFNNLTTQTDFTNSFKQ